MLEQQGKYRPIVTVQSSAANGIGSRMMRDSGTFDMLAVTQCWRIIGGDRQVNIGTRSKLFQEHGEQRQRQRLRSTSEADQTQA